MRLVFIDLGSEFIEEVRKLFGDEADYAQCDVTTVQQQGTAFVSPSNGLLFFDGGIDMAYSRMFPSLQEIAQTMLRTVGRRTFLGRRYLPVGCSMNVRVAEKTWVITAPTMFLPQDVSTTRNAYHAFMAALCGARKLDAARLVCPPLCCGYGKMLPAESAQQVRSAWEAFQSGNVPVTAEQHEDAFMTVGACDDQPDFYENTEIKRIEVVKKHR
jgi:O-acetyl-ADP-ribose deacetylase (regulator of RNase III)